jgi:DNA-binding NarL/FixJ family response regulator
MKEQKGSFGLDFSVFSRENARMTIEQRLDAIENALEHILHILSKPKKVDARLPEMLDALAHGSSIRDIADAYHINQSTVYRIIASAS